MIKKDDKKWFISIAFICLITSISIILNLSFYRQILGFFFITVLPGYLILKILKIDEIEPVEKFVLSVGFSISFLMLFGLFINNILYSLGYLFPLSTTSLLITLNVVIIILASVGCYINANTIISLPRIKLTQSEKSFLIFPIIFLSLSIFGTYLMNTTNNNKIILLLLFLIISYIAIICVSNCKISKRLYPSIIFLISLSLLLLLSLRTYHIIGVDTHTEFYIFQTTLNNKHWEVIVGNSLDACLSISVLPTIYQSILNVHSESLFKSLYSLLYSISPVIVYLLSKNYVEELYAFLASCFFMFQYNFLWTTANARTNLAILFFLLAMLVIFNGNISIMKKRLLFIFFILSCVLSHYSTTYIAFFVLSGAIVGVEILSQKYVFERYITLRIIPLYFSLIFVWYGQLTQFAFKSGVQFIENTLSNLKFFFIEESREPSMQSLQGGWINQGIPSIIEFILTWVIIICIFVGVVTSIIKYKEMLSLDMKSKTSNYLKYKFHVEYFLITLIFSVVLFIMFSFPYVSKNYGVERLYSLASTVLSVFFVLGVIVLVNYFFVNIIKKKQGNYLRVQTSLLIVMLLFFYLFSITGVTYNIFGESRSIFLNSDGEMYNQLYIYDQEYSSAEWLENHHADNTKLYTDYWGYYRLISQALYPPNLIDRMTLTMHKEFNGYLYFRYQNVVEGKLVSSNTSDVNYLIDYANMLSRINKIYCNGGSEIYK